MTIEEIKQAAEKEYPYSNDEPWAEKQAAFIAGAQLVMEGQKGGYTKEDMQKMLEIAAYYVKEHGYGGSSITRHFANIHIDDFLKEIQTVSIKSGL